MHRLFNFLHFGLNCSLIHGFVIDWFSISILHERLKFGQLLSNRFKIGRIEFVFVLIKRTSGLVDDLVGHVPQFNLGLSSLVLFCKGFCFSNLGLDFVFRERGLGFNLDRLFLASAHVFGTNVDDTVCVDVEGNLNLRNATRSRRNVRQVELAERHVVFSELTLTLQNVDFNSRLVVACCRVDFTSSCRNGCVPLDHGRGNATKGLDTEGQWCNVEEEDVGNIVITSDDTCLERSTHCNGFVRIDAFVRSLASLLFDGRLDSRNTC